MSPVSRPPLPTRRLLGALAGALLGSLLLAACARAPAPQAAGAGGENAIVQERERGPVKVVLRVEPREPTYADRVRLTIEATAKKGVDVTLPPPGENLGEFLIKDYDEPPPSTAGETTTYRRSYVLELLTSGEYRIPPMTIAFRDRRQGRGLEAAVKSEGAVTSEGEKHEGAVSSEGEKHDSEKHSSEAAPELKIVTDEIAVNVKPLADAESLKELAPIAPPAEPEAIPASLRWPLVIAGGLAACGLLAYLAVRRLRRPARLPPPVPAHERAYRELEWLLGQSFLEQGALKEFFFHLSRILREYIENRFRVRAPELTTEEFLEELSRRHELSAGAPVEIPREHRTLLREFLERCDLVKFARYTPGREEIEATFDAAKRFIEESSAAGRRAGPETKLGAGAGPGTGPVGTQPLGAAGSAQPHTVRT